MKNNTKKLWQKISLPFEMIHKIILNLPVKSILQFRTVSKEYNNLITSSDFIDQHRQSNVCLRVMFAPRTAPFEIYCCSLSPRIGDLQYVDSIQVTDVDSIKEVDGGTKIEISAANVGDSGGDESAAADEDNDDLQQVFEFDDEDEEDEEVFQIAGSVDGLVCLYLMDFVATIYVWNPSTRCIRELPKHLMHTPTQYIGIGYNRIKDDYIVIQFVPKNGAHFSIYSMSENEWFYGLRCITHSPTTHATYLGGAFFWIALVNDVEDGAIYGQLDGHNDILKLDIQTMEFSSTSLPDEVVAELTQHKQARISLNVFAGDLYLQLVLQNNTQLWLYSAVEGIVEWTCKIRLSHYFDELFGEKCMIEVLSAFEGEEILLRYGRTIFKYSPEASHWKEEIQGHKRIMMLQFEIPYEQLTGINRVHTIDKDDANLNFEVESVTYKETLFCF